MDAEAIRSLLATVHPSSHSMPPSTFALSRRRVEELTDDILAVDDWVLSVGGSQRESWWGDAFYMVPTAALEA